MTDGTLPIPEEIPAAGGDNVTELARLWWNGDQPAMIIRPALMNPELMGAVLAELAWNFSRAYAGSHGMDQAESLKSIVRGWSEAHVRAAGMKAPPLMPSVTIDKSEEA
ncbi:MAG: DUF5076 domain-containing protein [Brevundimonas sp.]|uniref:DUF5076 domain-containing protein n=1 Tax=Brevundimonas sp. TaxID=1871086 RepID=UPI002715FA73|nr:DUF5076 domain-containing protein [Brevundimonas sp.]MDO9586830.1 DUF5076 domain-containing protein [Brevundimonas sp.]MDP3370210.1 DUF5076 domain-containing protein [Brevundimonas sp.]MDP3658296.1 DUF5076 domain-containing protein [Brevundimonas sp.]MDZ4113325.1 DUF5076 domain-containing protein [Brevundimonas sp.]